MAGVSGRLGVRGQVQSPLSLMRQNHPPSISEIARVEWKNPPFISEIHPKIPRSLAAARVLRTENRYLWQILHLWKSESRYLWHFSFPPYIRGHKTAPLTHDASNNLPHIAHMTCAQNEPERTSTKKALRTGMQHQSARLSPRRTPLATQAPRNVPSDRRPPDYRSPQ